MKRILTGTLAGVMAAGLLILGQQAIAQMGPQRPMRMMGDGDMMGREPGMGMMGPGSMDGISEEMAEKLKLTDDQKNAMKNLRSAFERDMIKLRADMDVAELDLRDIMEQANPKVADAKARAARVNDARAKIFARMITFQVEMKNTLTPELHKTLQEERSKMRQERREEMRERRGERGEGSMRPRGRFGPR